MKTIITIQENRKQLVLTPETDFDKTIIESLKECKEEKVEVKSGSFYECQGGWTRQGMDDDSLIFVFNENN